MQIPAQKCCREHGKWTEHAANCCKYRGKYNGKWEVRTQNRCTYRGNGSFQLQNAANSMENGESRKSKKNPQTKQKIPKQFPTLLHRGHRSAKAYFAKKYLTLGMYFSVSSRAPKILFQDCLSWLSCLSRVSNPPDSPMTVSYEDSSRECLTAVA